jgi:predicted glycoside hydrolase/deacetylase ChbG (UPF0249 family)
VSTKRLIVTADDLGQSSEANAGVGAAHQSGMVTSASLTAMAPAAAEGAALASTHSGLSIGLLVAFTSAPAAAPRREIASLVDGRGMLPVGLEGLAAARPAAVLIEARAQLRRFRELARGEPSHLAADEQACRVPAALEALVVLSWETGIPVRSVSREMRERLRQERVPTPDHFVDEWWLGGGREGLIRAIAQLPVATTELRCLAVHPAQREALLDFEARSALQATGAKLTPYAALVVDT